MDGFSDYDRLELQADQYARNAVPGVVNDDKPPLITRKQVRALIRDAFKEGRMTAPVPEPKPFSPASEDLYDQYLRVGAPGSYDQWLRAHLFS